MPSPSSDKNFVSDIFGRLDKSVGEMTKELDINTPYDVPEPPVSGNRQQQERKVQIPGNFLEQ